MNGQPENDNPLEEATSAASAANETLNKGVAARLLGPAFDELGEYFGERARNWVRRKQRENVESHFDAVKNNMGVEDIQITPKNYNAIKDWVPIGSQYSELDDESPITRAALESALRGGNNHIVVVLRECSIEDIADFCGYFSDRSTFYSSKPLVGAETFEKNGLLMHQDAQYPVPMILMMLALTFSTLLFIDMSFNIGILNFFSSTRVYISSVPDTVTNVFSSIISVLLLIMMYLTTIYRHVYVITKRGRQFVDTVSEYMAKRADNQKTPAPSAADRSNPRH